MFTTFNKLILALPLCAFAFGAAAGPSTPIAGQYIVVFKDHVLNPHAEASTLVSTHGGRLLHTYGAAIKGFAAQLPDAAVNALARNPNVESIEQDMTVSLNTTTQTSPTWGLDRVDQHDLPLLGMYSYNYTGLGVTAFIIDTGIRSDHVDFGGRVLASEGYTAISDTNGTNDCNGHGTHVSGTVGGSTYGVAKQVTLIPVRVLDCSGSGSYSGVIAGIDYAANSTRRPAVANMSLGGSKSSSVNTAVAGAVSKGVTMVVAAGNETTDACTKSPASEPSAITVGATTSTDARASYSNYGTCVDLFAPGSSIKSDWYLSSTATNTISGTSMATPHVTGIAALAAEANPGATPATIASLILSSATTNKVTSAGTGSPNRMAYSLVGVAAASTPIAVSSVTGAGIKASKSAWKARATVTIRNLSTNAGITGITVTGSFAPGGGASCVTGSTGSCSMDSASLSNGTASTTFTVTNATGTATTYESSQNTSSSVVIKHP